MKPKSFLYIIATVILAINSISCKQSLKKENTSTTKSSSQQEGTEIIALNPPAESRQISKKFKDYWYSREAEITSYKLEQAEQGQIHTGTAVMIYETQSVLPKIHVKSSAKNPHNIPVLKLNTTKKFNTSINSFSMMTSTFYPVYKKQHAIKISQSTQEWAGQQYAQLNNRDKFEIKSYSNLEGIEDKEYSIEKTHLENEIWTQIRINPADLPTGDIKMVPDFSHSRLKRIILQEYTATATNTPGEYTLEYPTLNRKLVINYDTEFPYTINSWKESFKNRGGPKSKFITTKATKIKTIKSRYRRNTDKKHTPLRVDLGL